jgi:hypothetical protein
MGDYELTGLKDKGHMAVDFGHGCGLLSPEDQQKMELILTERLDSIWAQVDFFGREFLRPAEQIAH